MSWPLLVALLALAAALARRWHRTHDGRIDLEGVALSLALGLGIVGLLATGLGLVGRFGALEMTVGCGAGALAIWPWRPPRSVGRGPPGLPRSRAALGLFLLLAALGLRFPPIASPLAGRDQGTYTLRAQHSMRTGEIALTDALLAEETSALRSAVARPGPGDVLGLFPRADEAWRRGVYESAYRPGFYVVDRDAGRVAPQFFHLHPMLMATTGLVLGPERVHWILGLEALLALLASWAIARRIWPAGPWAELCLALLAFSPLAIWVNRVALTETLCAGLFAGAVLAVLRSRDGEPALLVRAALLFGLVAWLRGNAWITAPAVMAVLLVRPRVFRPGRGALLTLAALVLASVVVHASTSFPYLHDELHRLFAPATGFGPAAVIGCAVLLILVVVGVDLALTLGLRRPPRWFLRWLARAPLVLAGFALAFALVYVVLRVRSPAEPFSRLDPALPSLGPALLAFAAVGLGRLAWGWRPRWRQADVWLLAFACVPVVTLGVYARRNLPQGGLYYYGRYLVPELLPAACLLAVAGLYGVHRHLTRARPRLASVVATTGAAGLLWSTGGVLLTHPQTRLVEFEGAERAVTWLADRIEPDAIVVAGGEGWHHDHTYNQVGGALAIGHGRTVLPYTSREAAYATLHELLISRPEATGREAPAVYLLLNEASHGYTRPDGARVAGIDDVLPPPFEIGEAALVELFTDRLTPVTDAVPIRVTRDVLRMALFRVEVDASALAASQRWRLSGHDGRGLERAHGLVADGRPVDGRWCLDPRRPLAISLPGALPPGPGSLVIVAEAGTATDNQDWRLAVDGERVALDMPRAGRRERDTLGPFPRVNAPARIELWGSPRTNPLAPCPHGAVAELRWLGPDRARLADVEDPMAITIGPSDDLGHPEPETGWASTRALSRYRPGTGPRAEVHARSLVLTPQRPVHFLPVFPPGVGRASDVDLVVTLTGTSLAPGARIGLRIDGEEFVRLDPPDAGDAAWQSEVVRARLEHPLVTVELELIADGDPEHYARIRDVALFGTGRMVESHRSP